MTDALRRALRTGVQTFLGTIITSGILSSVEESGVVDWSGLKKVGISALAAAIVAVLTWVQNWLEDSTSFPAIAKSEKAAVNLTTVLIVLAIVAVALYVLTTYDFEVVKQ